MHQTAKKASVNICTNLKLYEDSQILYHLNPCHRYHVNPHHIGYDSRLRYTPTNAVR